MLTLYRVFTLLVLSISVSCAAASIDSMNDIEIKACGIEKLSKEEKLALNAWIEAQIPKVQEVQKPNLGEYEITDVEALGQFITLSNGLHVNVHARSRKRTMAWKKGEKVRLVEPNRARSFKLTNLSKKQTVSAKEK
jgi:hypothetical protein